MCDNETRKCNEYKKLSNEIGDCRNIIRLNDIRRSLRELTILAEERLSFLDKAAK